jgi:dipeptidyl aminopeptidase/acylaminoacyl peptidase
MLVAWAFGLALATAAPLRAAPAALAPAELFAEPVDMSHPRLSPSGDALAVLVRNRAGRRELAVIDLANPGRPTMNIAARVDGADIFSAHWIDDRRLVFEVGHENESLRDLSPGVLYAVDRDGANSRLLIGTDCCFDGGVPQASQHALTADHRFMRTLADGSGDIIVLWSGGGSCIGGGQHYHCEGSHPLPYRLDTRTGRVRTLVRPPLPDDASDWIVDDQGQVRALHTQHAGTTGLYVPAAAGGWSRIASFDQDGSADAWRLDTIGVDGRIYVTRPSGDAGSDRALYILDMETGRAGSTPVLSVAGFDVEGALVEDARSRKVIGAHYEADAGGTAWFIAEMRVLQDRVDAMLPGRVNRIDPASCGCAPRVLVTSWSDRQPMQFLLFDRDSGALTPIGETRPKVVASQMASTDFFRIRARDGGDLPVYVTRPRGKGPWPTVVLVHGGPFLRGWQWAWDEESQFLASRGYLVVKPEFRGSEGYGERLFRAGMREWGLKMQDDIADATTWAAKKGLADPQRTCIAGGSYGGYATLMGLVRYPDLYRCGIAWAAVTDIELLFDLWWSDASDESRAYGMRVMLGDPVKDAARLADTSPLRQAARITRPLMLVHGGLDERVPPEHAQRLRSELESRKAPLTWVFYADEGHGWSKPANRADFLRREEAFLARNIGDAAPAPEVASTPVR